MKISARIDDYKDIPLDDLVIGKGQVRTSDVAEGIDELAKSIQEVGLLHPIVVCPAEKKGKYEILIGQRRFLACRTLKKKRSRLQFLTRGSMKLPQRCTRSLKISSAKG